MTTVTVGPVAPEVESGATVAPPAVERLLEAEARVRRRLDELSELTTGWDEEQARTIEPLALRTASMVARHLMHERLPELEVFPVPDGGAQLEWRAGPIELETDIEPGGAVAFVCDDERSGQRLDGELGTDASLLALARISAYA